MDHKRRELIQRAAALGIAATALPFAQEAYAKDTLTVLEQGPPPFDAIKKMAAKWDKTDITWSLHVGGMAASLAKVKAVWPNFLYDVADLYSPVFTAFIREGFAETITLADVPNLKDVPERFLAKDDKGNIKNVPFSMDGSYFAVRTDRCPIEIKTIEDLLNPRLKGQIAWPVPTNYSNIPMVLLSLARGGNEFKMDPGFKFMEELAKSGNIGHLVAANTEMMNSISTGECSIVYATNGGLTSLAKRLPIKPLTKVDSSMKAAMFVVGWMVLANAKHKKSAMEFVNFLSSKENSELYHREIAQVPCNPAVKASADAAPIAFTPQEFDKFAYIPDWAYVSTQIDSWVKRFERDIAPKI